MSQKRNNLVAAPLWTRAHAYAAAHRRAVSLGACAALFLLIPVDVLTSEDWG
jgi:hypothetical protein